MSKTDNVTATEGKTGVAAGAPGSAALEIAALRRELKSKDHMIHLMCEEWAEDHTHIQKLCREVGCDEQAVDGDSYGVPGIIDLADLLRARACEPNTSMRHAGPETRKDKP